jgi:type IV pilus assembly protein PilY1
MTASIFGFLMLIVALTTEAKLPPPGTGKADVPANILIMLDTSGSMSARTNTSGLRYPRDASVDSQGNVFIVDTNYHRIHKYNSVGKLIKTIGGWGRSNGKFYYPYKIDIDSNDNIYVADYYNSRIQKLDKNGNWLKNFTGLSNPRSVTVDASGNVYAANFRSNGKTYKWNSSGSLVTSWPAYYVRGLSAHNGSVYTAGYYDRKIYKYSDAGSLQTSWSTGYYAYDVEATANGIYIPSSQHTVRKYSDSGTYLSQWGGLGRANTQFYYPLGIGSDSSGNIYVADYYNYAVKKFDKNGVYISAIGGNSGTRLADAKKVIKKLVSSSDLTKGANFGLMKWHSRANMLVNVNSTGASKVYTVVDTLRAGGGTNLDSAMNLAHSYFSGGNSPINSKASCQKNFLIVISDGHWSDRRATMIAENLYKNKGIQTFVIGFGSSVGAGSYSHTNYVKIAKAGGTYPDSPLYSGNWQHLYETLSSYIRQAISSNLSFTAPVIMPGISTADHLFQSTFSYKKNHQWKGQLTKYKLQSDGTLGASVWDAGKKLDDKSESSRKIWTIANNMGISTSTNNFTTANLAGLKDLIWENSGKSPTDVEGTDLINFVRGIDAYDEDGDSSKTDKRWKLGDIYHSRLAIVGVPSAKSTDKASKSNSEAYYRYQNNYDTFKNTHKTRKEIVYVGANDGMLHAFDSISGEELWGFIPPTMLQSLRSMVSTKANSSHSIYGVDGSPVVKDIFYNNQWRTVLLNGMGRGGHGYFALDITNADSPVFLFAFQNDPVNSQIYHWDDTGNRTDMGYVSGIPAEYDYSKLGEAWSTPTIVAMPVGKTRKWVAVFGAGYNGGVNTNYGSAVYVIDLEAKGKVLKRIDLADSTNNIANSLPATLTAITPDTTSKADYKGALFYFADLEGKFWKLNLTDKNTLYEVTEFFNAEATQENDRMTFFQVTPSIGIDGNLWLYYATGNQQKLQRMSSNIKNRIFGFKDVNFPEFKVVNSSTVKKLNNNTYIGGICPTSADFGWYVDLDAHEKITGKLAVHNETIYASRYVPNNKNLCSPGSSALSEHSSACGKMSRKTNLGEGVATGPVIHKGKIYIGISGGGTGDLKDDSGKVVGSRKDNLIVLSPKKGSKSKGSATHESWREVF